MDSKVFDFLDARILTFYDSMQTILSGGMPPPRTAIFYPSYTCNQACPSCEYKDDNREINVIMDGKDMKKLLLDLIDLGVKSVEFCGGGEPTLHPDLADNIRWLNTKGVKTGVLTNGTMISGKLLNSVIRYSSYLRVSFDAATEETFNKSRCPTPGAGFNTVVKNIKNAVSFRKKTGSKISLSIKFLVSKYNVHEIVDAVDFARNLGVDAIQFKAVRLYKNLFNDEIEEMARKNIALARKKFPNFLICGGVDKFEIQKDCWLTPLQVTVDALGYVFLCFNYRHRRKSHCIGNALENPIKEIWYGDRHFDAIRRIKPQECNNLDCRFVNYNQMMQKLIVDGLGQFEFI